MTSRTTRAATTGLVALLAADIALVVLSLRHTAPLAGDETVPTSSTTATISTSPTTPERAVTSSPAASTSRSTASVKVSPVAVMIVAIDGSVAWRIKAGSCEAGGGAVAVTTDGGKSFKDRKSPLRVIAGVQPTSADRAFMVGASRACDMEGRTTADGGASWGPASRVTDVWTRDARDDQVVLSSGSRSSRPCGEGVVVDLTRLSAGGAQVLCADSTLKSTNDSGASWQAAGDAPGALALDDRQGPNGITAYVVRPGEKCRGLEIVQRDNGGAGVPKPVGCAELPLEGVKPGTVSLSVVGNDGWLAVGDDMWRSRDGLRTWAKA